MIFGKYINRYYLRHAPVLLLGILALLMVDYIQLLVPQLYRLVINGVNLGQVVVRGETMPFTKEVLFQHICLPMIWIVLFMVVGRFLWRICFFGTSIRVQADLREKMFDHSRRLSQQYYQVNKVGNLMSLYTNDLDTIQECFGDGILMFFDALVLGLLALYRMWCMDRRMTMLALIPAAFMFAIGTVMGKTMTKTWEKRQQAFSDLSDFAQENFSGIAVIKAFVKEYKELTAFRKLNRENEEINVTYTKIATLLEVLVTLFVESVICVILGYGGYLVYQGQFNAGQLVEYIGYFEAIVWPIMAISMLIEKTSRGKASLNRITELLDAPIDVADRPGVQELQNPQGSVEFRHLTFRYPDGEYDVLQDISFTIHPGESVGIVGKTGAGKTALVDLLLRTYNVPDGTLFVDGKDVNTLSIHSVRAACAYVPQDNFLFSDTIAHNIGFGVDDASPEMIDHAASLAEITTVYSHPQPLAQCGGWLRSHLPQAGLIPVESTAAAARMAAATPQSAAIGNGKLADMTGLSILARRIEDEPGNWTRFVIIGPRPVGQLDKLPRTTPVPGHTGADKTSMLFTLPDKSGALSGVLSLLAEHKINMRKLESRPLRGQCWKYVFFTDVECDLTAPQYEDLLQKLAETCTSFRILGSYATGPQLDRIGLDDVEDGHA